MFPVFSPRAPFQGARARVRGFEFRRLLLARRSAGGNSILILNVPHLFSPRPFPGGEGKGEGV